MVSAGVTAHHAYRAVRVRTQRGPPHRAVVLACVIVSIAAAGCLNVSEGSLETQHSATVPISDESTPTTNQPGADDEQGAGPEDNQPSNHRTTQSARPPLRVAAKDARADPYDPFGDMVIEVQVWPPGGQWSRGTVDVRVHDQDGNSPGGFTQATRDEDATRPASGTHEFEMPPGNHTINITASWRPKAETGSNTNATAASASPDRNHTGHATITMVRYAPMTIELDARTQWYDDQSTFHEIYDVAIAPWDDESGLDALQRASARYGFDVATVWYPDLDAHYVESINGTDERWQEVGGVHTGTSWSWMIEVGGDTADRSIGHLRPTADTHLALRYLECNQTGSCRAGATQ